MYEPVNVHNVKRFAIDGCQKYETDKFFGKVVETVRE